MPWSTEIYNKNICTYLQHIYNAHAGYALSLCNYELSHERSTEPTFPTRYSAPLIILPTQHLLDSSFAVGDRGKWTPKTEQFIVISKLPAVSVVVTNFSDPCCICAAMYQWVHISRGLLDLIIASASMIHSEAAGTVSPPITAWDLILTYYLVWRAVYASQQ